MSVNIVAMLDKDLARQIANAGRKADEWTTERNRLICAANAAGASTREIAAVLSITHAAVWKIVRNEATPTA